MLTDFRSMQNIQFLKLAYLGYITA